MGNTPSAPVTPPAFEASEFVLAVTAVFGFLHALSGLLAIFFETDLLYGFLLEVDSFKVPALTKDSLYGFLRGPKRTGRGTATNVRGWGARQVTVSVPFWFALMTGEKVAFQIAFLCLLSRICGDYASNLLDGCYWKLAPFTVFEGFACYMVSDLLM
mmetsp:Transcript_14684/g.49379  ORF Transcript_14684/g.49379 Transcript_14684/m.49379 type:complete len:157 (-) Transcript_14684:140-610(-)